MSELYARHGDHMHGSDDMHGMDHSDSGHMHGMDGMGSMDGDKPMCSMNMLGNWETIGACFLTSSWMVSSGAEFAGSCIGVAFWVILAECIRRFAREYDRIIVAGAVENITKTQQEFPEKWLENSSNGTLASNESQDHQSFPTRALGMVFGVPPQALRIHGLRIRPTFVQQCIRTILYGIQFTSAYLIMLIAMTYNGYMLLSIILGAMVGYFATSWDMLGTVPATSLIPQRSEKMGVNSRSGESSAVGVETTNYNAMNGSVCGL